jgi:hypothetical protein
LLREAAKFFPSASLLHEAWADYAGRVWKRSCRHDVCPHPPGSVEEIFWKMLRLRNRVLKPRMIRLVLAMS